MPRRGAPASTTVPTTAQTQAQAQQDAVSDGVDSHELPRTLVMRIAKGSIPESSKLAKDTVTALVKGSTVFINYLAATAHEIAASRQHKSVSASDVLKALEIIQFEDMVEQFQQELQIYREHAKVKKSSGIGKAGGEGGSTGAPTSGRTKVSKGKAAERVAEARAGARAGVDTQQDEQLSSQHEPGTEPIVGVLLSAPLQSRTSHDAFSSTVRENVGQAGRASDQDDEEELVEEDEEEDEEDVDELADDVDDEGDALMGGRPLEQ